MGDEWIVIVWAVVGAVFGLLALYLVVRFAIVHALRDYHDPKPEPDDWQKRPTS